MADIYTIAKTFRPRRTILSDDFNATENSIKAAFDSLGEAPAVGRKGVSTPFAVGTPTESYHAVDKATLDSSPASAAASAASAAEAADSATAADASATAAAASEAAAAASVSVVLQRTLVDDADYSVPAGGESREVYVKLATTARTVTLPSTPGEGQLVAVYDLMFRAGLYNITVDRNGKNIHGAAQDLVLDVDGAGVVLVYLGGEWWLRGVER